MGNSIMLVPRDLIFKLSTVNSRSLKVRIVFSGLTVYFFWEGFLGRAVLVVETLVKCPITEQGRIPNTHSLSQIWTNMTERKEQCNHTSGMSNVQQSNFLINYVIDPWFLFLNSNQAVLAYYLFVLKERIFAWKKGTSITWLKLDVTCSMVLCLFFFKWSAV